MDLEKQKEVKTEKEGEIEVAKQKEKEERLEPFRGMKVKMGKGDN